MSLDLSNTEYDNLMGMRKEFVSAPQLPFDNEKKNYIVKSSEGNEYFLLSVERKNIFELSRSKLNTSYSKEPIFRVEVNARPHMNPDREIIGRNHVHVYREGYGMSWAYNLDTFHDFLFKAPDNFTNLFSDFCTYCNIQSIDLQGVI